MRDWQGATYEVRVLDRGVLYKRKRYRSLSEVARLDLAGAASCIQSSLNLHSLNPIVMTTFSQSFSTTTCAELP